MLSFIEIPFDFCAWPGDAIKAGTPCSIRRKGRSPDGSLFMQFAGACIHPDMRAGRLSTDGRYVAAARVTYGGVLGVAAEYVLRRLLAPVGYHQRREAFRDATAG
jgi:hypothetical protein